MPRQSEPRNRPLDLDFERDPAILASLGNQLGLGIFTVDAEGRFVAWSKGAERITGYSAPEILGQPCRMLEGPDCKGFSGLSELLQVARGGRNQELAAGMDNQECRVFSKECRELRLLGSARLLHDEKGQVIGAIGSFANITEILKLNAAVPATHGAHGLAGLIGEGPAIKEVFRRIRLAADSDVTTLITGESGTGKELAARAIHSLSDRSSGPFVAINCAAIPETLLESELFGHVKGSFTGAVRDRAGVFESARGGTLFLDEIGDVSPLLQLKLLRVLQEREIRRVGDDNPIPTDVRLLSATNRDLMERIEEERIREDFYYRIRVFDIHMPSLRERAEDIPVLAQHFLEQVSQTHGKSTRGISQDGLERLVQYHWPGNVRELRNAIEHALVVQRGDTVGLLDLPTNVRGSANTTRTALGARELTPEQEAERLRILAALESNRWNRSSTAESLGVSRVTLWKKMGRYQIEAENPKRAGGRTGGP